MLHQRPDLEAAVALLRVAGRQGRPRLAEPQRPVPLDLHDVGVPGHGVEGPVTPRPHEMNGRLLAQQGQPLMQPYLVGIAQRVGEHEAGLLDRHGHDILRA